MRCARVKGLLSDYIEGLLDAEREGLVKTHLSKCEKCRKELESLQGMLRELRSLEPLNAPPDFLDQLHERLQKKAWLERIKAFLFVPLRIKIPLQVATLASTAVLVFFIYHLVYWMQPGKSDQAPELKTVLPSSEVSLKSQAEINKIGNTGKETAGPVADMKNDVSQSKGTDKDKSQIAFSTYDDRRKSGELSKQADQKRSRQTQSSVASSSKLEERQAQTIQIERETTSTAAPGVQNGAAGDALKSESVSAKAVSAEKTPPALPLAHKGGEEINEEQVQLVLVVKPEQVQFLFSENQGKNRPAETPKKAEASSASGVSSPSPGFYRGMVAGGTLALGIPSQIKAIVTPLGGKIINTELNAKTQQPEFLTIELPVQNYQNFVNQLNDLGTLQAPAAESLKQSQKIMQNRLQIINP